MCYHRVVELGGWVSEGWLVKTSSMVRLDKCGCKVLTYGKCAEHSTKNTCERHCVKRPEGWLCMRQSQCRV